MNKKNIKLCRKCTSYFYNNVWRKGDIKKALQTLFLDEKPKESLPNLYKQIKLGQMSFILNNDKGQFSVSFSEKLCDTCSRTKSGYFEGIFQVRNKKNSNFPALIEKTQEKILARKGVFVSKIIESKTGVDFYISSNKYLISLSKELWKQFGGEIKHSKKLFSRDHMTNKEVYRGTILLRLTDYGVGDILIIKKSLYLITSIQGDRVKTNELKTGKHRAFPRIKKEDYEEIIPKSEFFRVVVVTTKPILTVLHPKTYETIRVENQIDTKEQNILVAEYKGKLYVID